MSPAGQTTYDLSLQNPFPHHPFYNVRFPNLEGILQCPARNHNPESRADYECKISDLDLAVTRKIDVILGARV